MATQDPQPRGLADAAPASETVPFSSSDTVQQTPEERVRLAYFVYASNLNKLLQPPNFDSSQEGARGWSRRETKINSKIIGAVINEPHRDRMALPEGQNVTVTLKHLVDGENPRCVYWNAEQ